MNEGCYYLWKKLTRTVIRISFWKQRFASDKGDAGTGKTRMAIEIMIEAMSRGYSPIFLTIGVTPEQVKRENLDDFIIDLTKLSGMLSLKDFMVNYANIPEFIRNTTSVLNKEIEKDKKVILIIDSIDELKVLMGLPQDDFSLEGIFLT